VTEDVKLLQLPRLSLGLSKLEKINAAVLDMEPVNETAGFTQSGILGGNFLRHFRIYFDFARGAMRLEPLNQKPKSVDNINPEVVVDSMKQALYLETSVIGAYLDNGEPFRRDLTIRWWEHEMPDYRAVVSPLVSSELSRLKEPHRTSYLKLISNLEQVDLTEEAAILAGRVHRARHLSSQVHC
jgi:hypothetical protein